MKHFAGSAILAVGLALVCAPQALADPIVISNVTGGWQNAVPPANADIQNQGGQAADSVYWGTSTDDANNSGYIFDPVNGDINPIMGTAFALGTFTHQNRPITSGTSITSIDYAFGFTTNGVPNALNDIFNFSHDETPNSAPCTYPGGSACADAVVVSAATLNSLITVGAGATAETYFFNLLGFSTNGGATISSQFISVEGGSNSAVLYGVVTPQPITRSVPDGGATMLMLGVGLVGIATLRNRFRI